MEHAQHRSALCQYIIAHSGGFIDKFLSKNWLGKFVFRYICWITLGRQSLDEFKADAGKDWKECNMRLRDAVEQITIVQGLVLAVCAAFLTTTPPLQSVDYTRPRSYLWFFLSFTISMWGLVCQILFFRVNLLLTMDGLTKYKLSYFMCLNYLLLYAMTYTGFLLSLLCLGSGTLEAILGGPFDILFFFLALVATLCVILIALSIRDTPGANIILITSGVSVTFWALIVVSFICALRIYF